MQDLFEIDDYQAKVHWPFLAHRWPSTVAPAVRSGEDFRRNLSAKEDDLFHQS